MICIPNTEIRSTSDYVIWLVSACTSPLTEYPGSATGDDDFQNLNLIILRFRIQLSCNNIKLAQITFLSGNMLKFPIQWKPLNRDASGVRILSRITDCPDYPMQFLLLDMNLF